MKQSKRLTREHKILLSDKGKDPKFYRLLREERTYIVFKNTVSGDTITLVKRIRR